jgi:hypothetical protein
MSAAVRVTGFSILAIFGNFGDLGNSPGSGDFGNPSENAYYLIIAPTPLFDIFIANKRGYAIRWVSARPSRS